MRDWYLLGIVIRDVQRNVKIGSKWGGVVAKYQKPGELTTTPKAIFFFSLLHGEGAFKLVNEKYGKPEEFQKGPL